MVRSRAIAPAVAGLNIASPGMSFYGSRAGSWSTSKVTEKSGASRRAD